jgi:DNA-binding transcriptional regulator YiaG
MATIAERVRVFFKSKNFVDLCRISPKDFTRERVLTFERITIFIINFVKKSLQLELYKFADFLHIPSCTKQAFSKARKKLDPKAFQLLNANLLQEFYSDNEIKTFKGLRALAIDGSTVHLPKTPELCEKFGFDAVNSAVPLARTSIMFDVLNRVTLHATLNHYQSNERTLALSHIESLLEQSRSIENQYFTDDLLLFDRGYPSLPLMMLLHTKRKHFIMRITHRFLRETNKVVNAGLRDTVVAISIFEQQHHVHPDFKEFINSLDKNTILNVRVLVFDLPNGKSEIIVTSLLDQDKFTYDDIYKLYGIRWNIEEEYKFHKSIAEIENFSGNTILAIEQDFHATIFSCNFSSLLMQEAQEELELIEKKGKYEYKANRNILIGIVKNEIIDIFLSNQSLDEYCKKLKDRIKKNLVPIRPNRNFPRKYRNTKSKINRRCL